MATGNFFNMATDLSETKNVAIENPEKVAELKALWNAWAIRMGLKIPAQLPTTHR